MLDELYLWGTAVVVGLLSLKLIPAKKLLPVNRRLRGRIPGVALIVLYAVIWALFFVGVYFLCLALSAPVVVRNVILGVMIGLAIGLTPIIDGRYTEEKPDDDNDKKE